MKWREFRRIIERKGWYCHRKGANHDIYCHRDRPSEYIIVERHDSQEIRTGLFNKLKKQVEL